MVVTELARNGSTTFAAVNDLATPACRTGTGRFISESAAIAAVFNARGEMVAVNQVTGKLEWDTGLPLAASQRLMIVAYKLEATGQLPETVGS